MSDKKEKIHCQHEERCEFFHKSQVCPNGSRCQRMHIYQGLDDERVVMAGNYLS
jgi:hypothetical protein